MANFKSDIITAKEQLKLSDAQHSTGDILLLLAATITLAGTEAATDTIQIADLPAGAIPVPQLCHVTGPDPGTTLTLDIGDADDPDRLADGIVLSAGGQIGFCSGTMPDAVANPVRLTENTRIYATVASADTVTADVKLVVTLAFRVRG